MNVYRIYIFIVDLFFTLLLIIDKKGENDFELYMHNDFKFMHIIEFMHVLCLYKEREKDFESLYKKGEKVFGEKNF